MSISVGTLIIDLQANTASFVSGMDKAGQIALTNSKNIQKAFTAMGGAIVAALGAAETAILAMIDHSIEMAAKIHDVAMAAGVSTEALSALGYAAKISGVDQDSMTKALEKMSKAMLAAQQQSAKGTNGFKELGISVADAQGKLRPTEQVLLDVADKISKMKDGSAKTAIAMQIFGKAGADMVPLLNEGKAGITALMDEAKKLGVVVDQDFADAADRFDDSMTKLKAAAEGFGNKLAKEVLPQFQLVIDNLIAGAEQSDGKFQDLVKVAGFATKAFIVAFSGIQTFFDDLGQSIKFWGASVLHVFDGIGSAGRAIWNRDWAALKTAVSDTYKFVEEDSRASAAESTKIWKEYVDGVKAFWNAAPDKGAGGNKPKASFEPNTKHNEAGANLAAEIERRIAQLEAEATAEGKLANAIAGTTAETIRGTAAAEGQKTIDELNARGKKEHISLTEQQKQRIQDATFALLAYKAALDVNKELEANIQKMGVELNSVKALAAAYLQGTEAIQQAQEDAKLAPFKKQVEDLRGAFESLGERTKENAKTYDTLASALAQADAKLAEEKDAIHQVTLAQRELQAAQTVHAQERFKDIQQELQDLEAIRQKLIAMGQSTLAVDAAIHDKTLEQQKDYDQLLLKIGGVKDGIKVFFDEYTKDGVSSAQKVHDVLKTTMEDFTNNLADQLATGKAHWQDFFNSIESMLLKLALNNLFKSLFGVLGNLGGGIGSFFGGLGGSFGGGKASGGDIGAGTIYRVHKDEWIMPKQPGTVLPVSKLPHGSAKSHITNVHIHGVTDFDSFKRNQSQIAADMYAMQVASARRNR